MKEKLIAAREAKAADLDDLELKYKKLQAKVKDGANSVPDGMRQGKTLMIEFSVENIQVSAASSILRWVSKLNAPFAPRRSSSVGLKRHSPPTEALGKWARTTSTRYVWR
jgi:hypothetical protein